MKSDIFNGDGITTSQGRRMDFKTWLGVLSGQGDYASWYNHRVEALTQNFTSQEFLTDMFGTIEETMDLNISYSGTLDVKLWKASFKTTDATKNLLYPTRFNATIALNQEYLATGYSIDTMMYKTTDEWSALIQGYEASMVRNKKMYEINKTVYMLYLTCLATGNFKTIEGLTATDGEPTPEQKYAYQKFRNAVRSYNMKWTTQFKGQLGNFQILFAPYAFEGALQSSGQVSITATSEQYNTYKNGEVIRWYGFDIREFPWLENNFFFNVDVAEDQRLQMNATGEDFDFTHLSAVLYLPDTIIRKAFKPFFTLGENGNFSGYFYTAFVGGQNVVDLARVFNFNLNVYIKPFNEARNMIILNEAPVEGDILDARKELANMYPTLYLGINKDNGYMTGDSDGSKTKAIIKQWIEASQKYRRQPDGSDLPLDSNIYNFKANWTNFNNISKASIEANKKAK